MDRLSAYAQRESQTETPEQRKKVEEESVIKLLEQLKIAKEQKETDQTPAVQNGDSGDHADSSAETASTTTATTAVDQTGDESAKEDNELEKSRGIPKNVKLFEIFHEQVATLVKMQRLTIQDTIGLLVSLANLAL
jgi:vacuolar protein sorting-associated protein 35